MDFICLSTDHNTATVAQREKLTLSADGLAQFYDTVRDTTLIEGCAELAILSTCNRVEVYAAVSNLGVVERLIAFWAELVDLNSAEITPFLKQYQGDEAQNHLFRVAAGLNSLVLGESQVLGQITHTFEHANSLHCTGPNLRARFRSAIRVGKRARTETEIGRNAVSISSVAVLLAKKTLGTLEGKRIMLIGTGTMGVLVLKSLQSYDVAHIDIVNRTQTSAQRLAEQYGGIAHPFGDMRQVMMQADVVITATSATQTIIDRNFMLAVMTERSAELVLIDIAVPRDVTESVRHVPGVHLFDVDALHGKLDDNLEKRKQAIPAIEQIIEEEFDQLEQKQRELMVRPTVKELRAKAEAIRVKEVARALRKLPNADEVSRQQIELLSQSLVKKLLHSPTLRLREEANLGNGDDMVQLTRVLFDLNEDGSV